MPNESGTEIKKKKKGVHINGKEIIFLDAPEICFPENAPLITEKRELYDILNELFQSGSGGGDVFYVNGSGTGITVTMVKNRGETQELVSENFTFATNTYKTVTTVSSGNTQIEKIWSKVAISEVLKDGITVWKFVLDAVGTVTAVLDSVGNDVLNGVTGEDGNSVITPTPEGIALGWALAYNNEQSNAKQKAMDAYRDGISDCDEINAAEGVGGGSGDGEGGGDGNGDGTGDGTGSGGIKLPDKNFDIMDLPANTGTGCKATFLYGYTEIHKGALIRNVVYCEYAELKPNWSGSSWYFYNGYMVRKFSSHFTPDVVFDTQYIAFEEYQLVNASDLNMTGDYRDPYGLLT